MKLDSGTIGYSDTQDRISIPTGTKEQKAALVAFVRETFPDKAEELVRVQTVEDVPMEPFKQLVELKSEDVMTNKETGETITLHRVVVAGTDTPVPMAVIKPAQEPYIRPRK